MSALKNALNIDDLRTMAQKRLPRALFEFIDRGAEDDQATRSIRTALERLYIVPKVLGEDGPRSLETTLFGRKLARPFAVAPTGAIGIVTYEGEIAAARAAAKAGIPYLASAMALTSLEDIAEKAGGDLWFQIYVFKELDPVEALMSRAERAGYHTLIVTVDSAGGSNREFNTRNHFSMPVRFTPKSVMDGMSKPGWALSVFVRTVLTSGMPRLANYPKTLQARQVGATAGPLSAMSTSNPPVTPAILKRIRDKWKGRLFVKGITRADDALTAVECGADGVMVSNHGGRMVDTILPSIEALPDVVAAIGDRAVVIYDGGVRRGSDIYKALALGAKLVLLGRAPIWGTTVAGEAGALHAFNLLSNELMRLMYQTGCVTIGDITADRVRWSKS
jgi:isopentenyl diphosphate isomerase/L-lactate dehydrogenase-like FMN-dependent dehydrogenase